MFVLFIVLQFEYGGIHARYQTPLKVAVQPALVKLKQYMPRPGAFVFYETGLKGIG